MQDSDDYKYVSIMFEDKFNSTPENPKFYGKDYLYKTRRTDLQKGQVIDLETIYGHSKVVIYRTNIDKTQAYKEANEIGCELDDLKEI